MSTRPPPLSSCLISRLAWVVVNWFTMSRAVWLRVFLTPALIPLWIWRKSTREELQKAGHGGDNRFSCAKHSVSLLVRVCLHAPVCMCGCARLCSDTFCVASSAPHSDSWKGDKETKVGMWLRESHKRRAVRADSQSTSKHPTSLIITQLHWTSARC